MTDRLLALVAFATLAGFLGILIWKVTLPDLGIVVLITLALVAADFLGVGRGRNRRR